VVTPASYVPDRGDIVWLELTPQAGREQAGRRPALVLSPKGYNRTVGLALMCPITSQIKGYPFEVPLPQKGKLQGVVLSDHIKSLDWRVRKIKFFSRAPTDVISDTVAKLHTLLIG